MPFEKIAPYLEDPLVLIGFSLLLFFGLARKIIGSGIIPRLTRHEGSRIMLRLLTYGFALALVVIAAASVQKYRELSEAEQQAAMKLIKKEIEGNIERVGELQKNIENILHNTKVVRDSLRHPDIHLLSTFFPVENTDPTADVPASLEYARQQMKIAQADGLFDNATEKHKFGQAAKVIAGTIDRTMPTFESLADVEGRRYRISSEVWENHLPILRKVDIIDISEIQLIYHDMKVLRENYSVAVNYAVQYLKILQTFFSNVDEPFTPERLAGVLAAERIFMTTILKYVETVVQKLEAINLRLISIDMTLG